MSNKDCSIIECQAHSTLVVNNCSNFDEVSKCRLVHKIATLEQALRMLLNRVNTVTAPHRHNKKPAEHAISGLANRQIVVEDMLKELSSFEK